MQQRNNNNIPAGFSRTDKIKIAIMTPIFAPILYFIAFKQYSVGFELSFACAVCLSVAVVYSINLPKYIQMYPAEATEKSFLVCAVLFAITTLICFWSMHTQTAKYLYNLVVIIPIGVLFIELQLHPTDPNKRKGVTLHHY